jgi:integrase
MAIAGAIDLRRNGLASLDRIAPSSSSLAFASHTTRTHLAKTMPLSKPCCYRMVLSSIKTSGSDMSIVKRGNSKFWYMQFQFNGEMYIRSTRTTNKKAAEQMEVEFKAKLHSQQYLGRKQRITLSEAFNQYKLSKQGIASYANLVAHETVLCRLLPMRKYIDELTSHDLERFKQNRMAEGVGAEIIKYGLLVTHGTWKHAAKLGYQVGQLEFPPIKIPKVPLRYLTEQEERRLLQELAPDREGSGLKPMAERSEELKGMMQDAYDLVILLLDTGARYSEIANIEWTRIDLAERTINLWRYKVQNETVLYMTDRVFDVLLRRSTKQASRYVFNNRDGESRGYSTQSIRKAILRAGIQNCRVHTLRHTHASRLIQNGMSVYEVREILGHGDIKTTMRYAHLEQRKVTSKARDVINRLNQKAADNRV